jgi:hypothetical protein
MAESAAAPDPDGYQRRGKVFSVRLSDEDRDQLLTLLGTNKRMHPGTIPWHVARSLGSFMVWAALQWKPPGETKPRNGRDVDGTVYRNGVAVARRVGTTKRARGGTTGRPGGRRAEGKKRR